MLSGCGSGGGGCINSGLEMHTLITANHHPPPLKISTCYNHFKPPRPPSWTTPFQPMNTSMPSRTNTTTFIGPRKKKIRRSDGALDVLWIKCECLNISVTEINHKDEVFNDSEWFNDDECMVTRWHSFRDDTSVVHGFSHRDRLWESNTMLTELREEMSYRVHLLLIVLIR